jgi:hypothetical protein
MPNIVFNSRYPDGPATRSYSSAFGRLTDITRCDWESYEKYDVALFMSYTKDLIDARAAKTEHPSLVVGIIDPRGSAVEPFLPFVDFIVVDSLEMKDFFSRYRLPIFTYYEYPDIPAIQKQHSEKDSIIIGYHGNKLHLTAMYPNLTKALELIGREYNIEFWAVYNLEQLGKWEMGVPEGVTVRHIQWHPNVYEEELSKVDIGITPGLLPVRNQQETKRKCAFSDNYFLETEDDYLIRFKVPSNPGRIIIFGKLGIPVVADFYPSALQWIRDTENGLLAYSCGGWYMALERLIRDHQLRGVLSARMSSSVKKVANFDIQNTEFLQFLGGIGGRNIQMPDLIQEATNQLVIRNRHVQRIMNSNVANAVKSMKRGMLSR